LADAGPAQSVLSGGFDHGFHLSACAPSAEAKSRSVPSFAPIGRASVIGCLDGPAEILQSLGMGDQPILAKERPQASITLGEVLYAKSKAPVPEQAWAKLVQSIATGDQLALHALYEMAHRSVFTLMMRITANRQTAEELTIDVFHDVWRRASRYDAANGTVLGWIMNQARSRAIDRLRFDSRKKRRDGGDLQPLAEAAADPCDVLELREQGVALKKALAALTPGEREAIETTFFGELTHAEAAARLNQPLGTIKTRIRSGLYKLRRMLTAEVRKT
jgi:RNA polymerase sigma-70 factor (ECF subfamily)